MGPKSKSVAAPKSPSLPLEHDRALPADPRDPRSQSTWPCNGSHEHKTNGGIASGTWSDCATCGPEDELHSSTRYSREVYDPECPGGHHQCPEDAEGALDRGPKAQCQHGEDLHQAGGIFNGDRGAQGQVDPDGGSSPKPKSSPPAAPCRACDPAVRGGSERGPESAVNADRRRNCPAERDCCRTSSSVSHVSARLRGGSDPIPEGTHASKQSLKPDDGAIAMHDGGRLVETDTKMVSLPCDQQHGNSSFALMNAQDNNEPEDAVFG